MSDRWLGYHFTILRIVPHVYRGEFVNVGIVLHSREADFLGMRVITEPGAIAALAPSVDAELLIRYLECYRAICEGDPRGGEIALLSAPERFHWLSAPRSDLLQPSPTHEGIGRDPSTALDEMFEKYVGRTA